MRPVRSLQIPPEVGKSPTDLHRFTQIFSSEFFCPTDFTDIHRYLLGRFFSHADFADDADFFTWDFFIHRTTRNLFGGFLLRRLLTDFRGCDLSGRCRYPLRLEKVPQIYTDLHRFFHRSFFVPQISQIYTDIYWDVFLVTQISQMTQIFSHGIFLFIGRHGIYSEVSC